MLLRQAMSHDLLAARGEVMFSIDFSFRVLAHVVREPPTASIRFGHEEFGLGRDGLP